jgi:hypothetical protein
MGVLSEIKIGFFQFDDISNGIGPDFATSLETVIST